MIWIGNRRWTPWSTDPVYQGYVRLEYQRERQRVEQERVRADQEQQRAEQARQRAERPAAQLRALGIDPDAESSL